MRIAGVAIVIAIVATTSIAAEWSGARMVLIWPLLPGVMAGVLYSGHGNHPTGGWIVSAFVNIVFYLSLSLIVRGIAQRVRVHR